MTNPKIKDGNSAILLASWNGHNEMIKFLLEKVMALLFSNRQKQESLMPFTKIGSFGEG